MLLLCLALAACAGRTYGDQPDGADSVVEAPAAAAPAPAASASPPARTQSGNNRIARGGHVPPPSQVAEPASVPDSQRLMEARGLCWMKVEEQKTIRDIDRRIAYVDKCVTEAMKAFR
jgi:hypothetical protein